MFWTEVRHIFFIPFSVHSCSSTYLTFIRYALSFNLCSESKQHEQDPFQLLLLLYISVHRSIKTDHVIVAEGLILIERHNSSIPCHIHFGSKIYLFYCHCTLKRGFNWNFHNEPRSLTNYFFLNLSHLIWDKIPAKQLGTLLIAISGIFIGALLS